MQCLFSELFCYSSYYHPNLYQILQSSSKKPFSIKIPTTLLDKIDELAEKNTRDKISEIVVAIEEHLENEERKALILEETSSDSSDTLQLLKHNAELMERIVKSQDEGK
ncbi:Arc family DNA-binding protein [Methanogenium sp. MK-MG]|uniref:CopG family ribbon-helix-helix protein n=1 Tax=Methanogenium sp. MK-MG TaxID=2599926 RepID=UPI0013EB502A